MSVGTLDEAIEALQEVVTDEQPCVERLCALLQTLAARHRDEARRAQAQKMEAIGRLAGGIAHDFNNALHVILSGADYVAENLAPDDALREEALEIRRAGERAAALTRQLLTFSQRQALDPRPVDVNDQLTQLEPLIRRLAGDRVQVDLDLDPTVTACHVDPKRLDDVLLNLVINAREAMPDGGRLSIETHELDGECGRQVSIVVRDTGAGMSAETQRHIFEPFFTTKEFGRGMGLGLSMVYGIVHQGGGTVDVSSAPGCGSSFRITYPCSPREVRPASHGHLRVVRAPPRTPARGETVLLAEDDDQVRPLVASMLRRAGYRVLVAAHGPEALALAEQHAGAIALLLSDVKMPGMTGPKLAERLRQTRPETPVLFMSGYAADGNSVGLVPDGMEVLGKPFTRDELLSRVHAKVSGEAAFG